MIDMNTRNSLLPTNKSSAIVERTLPNREYDNFVRRINGLKPGRYMIVLTVRGDCDYTITELGKVEK